MTRKPGQTTLATGGQGKEPNTEQRALIDTLEGIVLVDAGAGTGKTFTIARRYLNLLAERELDPEEILLITFTRNAAEEMRERILHLGQVPAAKLLDAPITTFHSMARRILTQHGFHAPSLLGIQEPLAPNFRVLENKVLEAELFAEFLRGFAGEHPEHRDHLRALHEPGNLLDLVKTLASKGILPTADGWYRDGEDLLDGDLDALQAAFEAVNQPQGGRQSKLRSELTGYRDKLFLPQAPLLDELRAGDGKQLQPHWAKTAFEEDRDGLKAFVHDVYHGYLAHALEENQLNFSFLLLLAYVLLIEQPKLREDVQRPYVMIDEFQDTSEVQFHLALLLSGQPNLCCVGDWKQSIYSFQHASVDNILAFQDRLARYASRLNREGDRVPYRPEHAAEVTTIGLTENYRSTQDILDLAEHALRVPGKQDETVDEAALDERIVHLHSNAAHPRSRIQALTSQDEVAAVLAKLQAIHANPDYGVEDPETGELVPPSWEDIAVLTRTRAFALRLQDKARAMGLPMAFEGGVEVFKTDPGKLLLAWLRLLEDKHSRRGWAVVLELAGYLLDEAAHILDQRAYPQDLLDFLARLRQLPSVGAQARAVFTRYGLRDGFTEALVETVQTSFEATYKTPGEIVRFVEDSLEAGNTVDVDDHQGDVVTVQTIHAAKGLEYPIVVLADLNQGRFPSAGGGFPSVIRYTDPVGLRASKVYAEPDGYPPYTYDVWSTWLLDRCLPSTDYDEERRLFYVAMSRAKQHLVLTAETRRPSPFLTHLPVELEEVELTPEPLQLDPPDERATLRLPTVDAPTPRRIAVGELVGEPQVTGGKGLRFGAALHDFAARHVRGRKPEPENEEQARVARVIDGFGGELQAEVPCQLPVHLDGHAVVIDGKIDLLSRSGDRLDVVDWKTTPAPQGLAAYARQVGTYAHILQAAYPEATVRAWVHYTEEDEPREVEVLESAQIEALVRDNVLGGDPAPQAAP